MAKIPQFAIKSDVTNEAIGIDDKLIKTESIAFELLG